MSNGPRPTRSAAPLRLDFAGGWTDVPPFSAREGGLVVNAAIARYARVEVEPGPPGITFRSEDLDQVVVARSSRELVTDGRLPLLQAAARMYPVMDARITTRSEAPAGSGLGSSGALDVALVGALARARGDDLDPLDIAESAWHLEVVEVGMPGGKQDQYAAALGGFRKMTFDDPRVESVPLALDDAFRDHLERHTILCYTGTSRISGRMISRVIEGYERGDELIVGAFRMMKETAALMVEALENGDVAGVGRLLSRNWSAQCALDPGMRTPEMAGLEAAVADRVLGGKAAGAGAGGCMFFIAADDPKAVAAAAAGAGATVLPLAWSAEGVTTW